MIPCIPIHQTSNPGAAAEVLNGRLEFGKSFADLMVRVAHDNQRGWHDAAVVPFGPLSLSPAAKSLHYGLEVFEAFKAYRQVDGRVALFRPNLNARRLNRSATRLSMPAIPEQIQLSAIQTLVSAVIDWVPAAQGASLYLRPAMIGTEGCLGVAPAKEHLYFVIASPVGPYFADGFHGIKVLIEEQRVRSARGGVGFTKAGGNYAASMQSKQRARDQGFDEVLWLDAAAHRYLEELSAMNVFLVKEGRLLTPPLSETILDGITRRSVIELAVDLGIDVEERPVEVDELAADIRRGAVTEMMAVGTAVVITPVSLLGFRGEHLSISDGAVGPVTRTLCDNLTGIQYGRIEDRFGWMVPVTTD